MIKGKRGPSLTKAKVKAIIAKKRREEKKKVDEGSTVEVKVGDGAEKGHEGRSEDTRAAGGTKYGEAASSSAAIRKDSPVSLSQLGIGSPLK